MPQFTGYQKEYSKGSTKMDDAVTGEHELIHRVGTGSRACDLTNASMSSKRRLIRYFLI